jgi:nicotinamidase-related amidase
MRGFPSDWFRRGDVALGRNRSLSQLPLELQSLSNEIVAELAPAAGELVVEKAAASVFSGTPLLYHLRGIGADSVIICGETTSGCVRAAAVDAVTHRYRVGVVGDCCFDRTQASHHVNLFDIHQKYGDVIDAPAAIEYFSTVRGWPAGAR